MLLVVILPDEPDIVGPMGEMVVPKRETEMFFEAVLKREMVGFNCVPVVLYVRNNQKSAPKCPHFLKS